MAMPNVRNLPDEVHRALRGPAVRLGGTEAEGSIILEETTVPEVGLNQ